VSQFIENAREIFEAAENSAAAGMSSADYTILMSSAQGGIHMIADSDWSLGALQQAHGAQLAYRVRHENGRVIVEGRDGQRKCHLEAEAVSKTAQFLLNSTPAWHARPAQVALLAA